MPSQIALRLPDRKLAQLDSLVARGSYKNRAEALRAGLDRLLEEERERQIAEEYRRAYAEKPQEEWVGEAGAILAGEVIADRDRGGRPG
jgi:Arc/MetJ-type ribon-helix-helix transcriptional regulator